MATDFQLAGRMVTLGAGAAQAPSLLKVGRRRQRRVGCDGTPADLALPGQDDLGRDPRIGGRIDEDGAKRRLELAVKDEIAFWNRLEQRGEDLA
jgi:hypothetical protein